MLFWVSRVMSKSSGLRKQASSRLAEPNMKNTRSSGSKSTPPYDHGFATRRGDIPIGAIQRAYSLEHVDPSRLAGGDQGEPVGLRQRHPIRARLGAARPAMTPDGATYVA